MRKAAYKPRRAILAFQIPITLPGDIGSIRPKMGANRGYMKGGRSPFGSLQINSASVVLRTNCKMQIERRNDVYRD